MENLQRIVVTFLILMMGLVFPFSVFASNLTTVSDTLSTLTQNVVANHTLLFVTPTGVESSTDTITIDFTDFTVGSVDYTDIDLGVDNDAVCDGPFTGKTLGAAAGAGQWGAAFASAVLTLTAPTDAAAGEITAGRCVQVLIGTNATGGNAQLTSPNDTNTHVIEIAGTFNDSNKVAVDFVADDSVLITGAVDATITFSINDTDIGFGTLDAGNPRWANAAGTGSGTDTSAHTLTVATNATNGWAVTYNGATLTSSGDTIAAVGAGGITNDADGTQGAEQFALGFSTNGDATIATGYDHNATPGNRDWSFVAGTTTTIVSEIVPTAAETISAYYLTNIAGDTEAGIYSTNITYIATATF